MQKRLYGRDWQHTILRTEILSGRNHTFSPNFIQFLLFRWLDCIVSRIHFHTTIVIRKEQMDDPIKNMVLAKFKLEMVKSEYEMSIKELKKDLEVKTKNVVDRLLNAVNQNKFVKKMTTWSSEEYEQLRKSTEFTEEIETAIEKIIEQKFLKKIEEWEAENHVIKEALESLIELLKKRSNSLEFHIKAVEDCMVGKTESIESNLTIAEKVIIGFTSPIWIPLAIAGGIIALPVIVVKGIKYLVHKSSAKKLFADKSDYMKMKSEEFLENTVNKEYISSIITKKFTEVKIHIDEMESNFLKQIRADMNVILAVLGKSFVLFEQAGYYAPIDDKCSIVKGELSMFTIEKVIPREIDIQDLSWERKPIGKGSFADVYKGTWEKTKESQVEVAVKVCSEPLNNKNAHQILSEEKILR